MPPDFGTFRYGGVQYPVPASTANSPLQDVDPALFWALDYFANVLQIHLGARWTAEVTAIGGSFAALYSTLVGYSTPIDPAPYLTVEQFKFPMLAVFRRSEKMTRRTINWSHDTAKWGVSFILPPLTPGQAERLDPFLTAVPRVIANRSEQGFDPAYRNGAKVWSSAFANLEDIGWPEGDRGAFPGIQGEMFPSWSGSITVNERQMRETDFGKFDAVDAAIDLKNATDGTLVPDFVDFKSDVKAPGPGG